MKAPPSLCPVALLLLFALLGASSCCPRPPPLVPGDTAGLRADAPRPDDVERVQATLRRFHAAVTGSEFASAYALLSGRHRARYSVETFRRDHAQAGAESLALLDRLASALGAGTAPLIEGDQATFPLGGGLSIGLLREEGGWFIDRLR